MSLVSLMKILGHRSYRMTLRYAAVTLETVGREFRQALDHLEGKYSDTFPKRTLPQKLPNPSRTLTDLNRWINANAPDSPEAKRTVKLLSKRINRLKLDIAKLLLIPN